MLGKFYIENIKKVPGGGREVLPVVLHKDTLQMTMLEVREKIDAGLKQHGYRLSKFHKIPFRDFPTSTCFKKTGGLLKEAFEIKSMAEVPMEAGGEYSKTIYFTVSRI